MKTGIYILILLFIFSCRSMWGDNPLGGKYSLLEGDRLQDKVIVICSGYSGGACIAGSMIVPSYDRHIVNGEYAEYVDAANSDKRWIVARTIQIKDSVRNYWIIDKESGKENESPIIKGPLNIQDFRTAKKILEIDIDL